MKHVYKNSYGVVEFEVVGPYQSVSGMWAKDFDQSCAFSLDDAEKIALITGNRHIQMVFPMWAKDKSFLIHHESSGSAALCRVTKIQFDSDVKPADELDRLNSLQSKSMVS